MTVPDPAFAATAPCPVCGKPGTADHHPFCGRRCADVDLGRWLTGQYRIPGPSLEALEDEQDGRVNAGSGSHP
jgi:endogenous inhibitor of DNA gyrase (YacG/DUF329 family)